MLIAGRCRRDDETKVIKEVLEMNFKRSIDLEKLYNGDGLSSQGVLQKVSFFNITSTFFLFFFCFN